MPLPRVVADNLVPVAVRRRPRRRRGASRAEAMPSAAADGAEFALLAAAAPPASADLPGLVVEGQVQSKWCWAAVAQAMARLHGLPSGAETQCQFAGRVFEANCCPKVEACNQDLSFGLVLTKAGYPAGNHHRVN